jgi:hypothetical protein
MGTQVKCLYKEALHLCVLSFCCYRSTAMTVLRSAPNG